MNSYSKKVAFLLKTICFLLFTEILFSCNENKYDSDNFKDGDWTEYIVGDGSKETSKDSAEFIRKVTYEHGTPVGMGKDYYPNGSLQCEYYLISNNYKKDFRPKDKYKGLVVWFTQDTTNVKEWSYFDDYGNLDLKKYYLNGLEEISKDKRFDMQSFLLHKKDFDFDLKLFARYKNNPAQYDADVNKIIARIYNNPELEELVKNDKSGYMLTLGISIGLRDLFKNNISLEKKVVPENYNYDSNENDYSSNEYSEQNSSSVNQHIEKPKEKCSTCYGSGKCNSCGKVQQDGYYNRSGSYIRISEIRTGMKICDKCHGRGTFGSDYDNPCGWCKGQGWEFCRTCNYNGHGSYVGQCQTCKGSGFRL